MSFVSEFQAHPFFVIVSSSSYDVLLHFDDKNDLCNDLGKSLQSISIADETSYMRDLTTFTFVLLAGICDTWHELVGFSTRYKRYVCNTDIMYAALLFPV